MSRYHRKTFLLPAAHEETFTAELWSCGILGCEVHEVDSGEVRIEAYLADPLPDAFASFDLSAWSSRGAASLEEQTFDERDWLEEYRTSASMIAVGQTFLVDPRDIDDPAPQESSDDRTVLRIPARTAFGTGSHESTRLAAALLEELGGHGLDLHGLDVLDVGTGSGILAMMALRLGARKAVGFDLDPAAALIAGQNAGLNGSSPALFAGRLAALRPAPAFDLALVNVLPERIVEEWPRLAGMLRSDARIISSGNLWDRRQELVERFAAAGWGVAGEKRDGEWVAFLLRRTRSTQGAGDGGG